MSVPDPVSITTSPGHDRADRGTIHASALLIGATAVIVRGVSGAGKSSLVLDLIATLAAEGRFATLIGDDRVSVEPVNGRVIVRAAPTIGGLIEQRGRGIISLPFEPAGVVGLVVDLIDSEPDRLPEIIDQNTDLCGVKIRRIAITGFGAPRVRLVLSAIDLKTAPSGATRSPAA